MKTSTFSVKGMTCGGCAKSITRILTDLAGVQSVEVSYAESTAVVTFDEKQQTEQTLGDAIEDAGFDVVR